MLYDGVSKVYRNTPFLAQNCKLLFLASQLLILARSVGVSQCLSRFSEVLAFDKIISSVHIK